MSENMKIWDAVKQPPPNALKMIQGGRLKGMTDINPQWRYRVMTEQFGMCGLGWKYEIDRLWTELATDDQVFAFAQISVFTKVGDTWSDPIPGVGGSMLVAKEREGLHTSDEAYKMAITDALSVALKMLGVGANIYEHLPTDTKYTKPSPDTPRPKSKPLMTESSSEASVADLKALQMEKGVGMFDLGRIMRDEFKWDVPPTLDKLNPEQINQLMEYLNKK